MIDTAAIGEIIAEYEKHGWKLRRALLSPASKDVVPRFADDVERTDSDLDALWFWRRSRPDAETWELRRLSGLPFALVAVVSTSAASDELESALEQVENDMRERTIA